MPKALPKIGKKEKALVHVAKTQLGLSEEDYRSVLASVGVKSSTELNHVQLDEVMKRFEAEGFKPKNRRPPQMRRAKADPKAPLLRKIAAIMADAGLSEVYVNGMAAHMFRVQSYLWLDQEQLWKIVAALSIYQNRKKGKDLDSGLRRNDGGKKR